jgi:hypothetical protein
MSGTYVPNVVSLVQAKTHKLKYMKQSGLKNILI